ncbi:MAG: hypothetical protein JXA78_14380 [Anaerolineales bacterium]|nr:hypothetical protein [Anaerolineales bacterium]
MSHPFESIAPHRRKAYFWSLLAATLVVMAVLNAVSAPLVTPAAPYGIVSYELAGDAAAARAILDSWDADARLRAAFGLGFDYLFMLAYCVTIALACVWAADTLRQRGWPLASWGAPLAWGQWLAAGLDALENLALACILFGAPALPWPEIARWSAVFKFALIFLGLVYAFYALTVSLLRRVSPRAP